MAAHVKSVLIMGPEGVGKRLLVNAICTETGANLFDLSAETIAGKYPGKSGLTMLIHMVMKVGKALQPSVIFINDAENTFLKKVPKKDELDPKRLKKDLPKTLKGWKPEDRLLLVGTTNKPQDSDHKGLCGLYQKIILVARPDYGSRQILFRVLIDKYGGTITNALNISDLARISDGFTGGLIEAAIKSVLTDRRLSQMSKKPITASEFLNPLSVRSQVFESDEKEFAEFFSKKTPLGKKRAKAMKGDDEDDGGKGGKGKKGKKSGKKGKKGKKK
ncbi:dynein regulatory complex protein 11-like [Symsagittifera roscoffensis]